MVWITDFGLAKAMEQDNVTQSGAMVGTLRYMAPEQFSGQADARSDIYGLGLTLYELLTLRPAFEDSSRSGLVAKIDARRAAHARGSSIRRFPRDLETIVLKAMAREPRDRYATAGELRGTWRVFSTTVRFSPAAHPLSNASGAGRVATGLWPRLLACSLALLVAVAVVASVGYVRTARANAQEKIQRDKAEETSALALEALDSIFRQFTPDRTAPASATLRVSDAEDPIALPVQPVLSKEAAALLEHMLKFYDRLAEQESGDSRLHRKVAEANRRVGDIRQRLGQYAESKAAYLRAIDLYARLAKSAPADTDLQTEIARIHNELGNVYDALGDLEAGRKSHLDALAALRTVSAESSAVPDCQYELRAPAIFWASAAADWWGRRLGWMVRTSRTTGAAGRPVSFSIPAGRTTGRFPPSPWPPATRARSPSTRHWPSGSNSTAIPLGRQADASLRTDHRHSRAKTEASTTGRRRSSGWNGWWPIIPRCPAIATSWPAAIARCLPRRLAAA